MTHGSLFSGIGGAELAASWMGWENVFHCEINKYNLKLLKQHFPKSISYEDIKTTEFIQHRGRIDILTGGFPCQPFSTAGKRKGTADDRHLWPEMLRAIREIQPRWIVGENVRGLTNWDGGVVFDQVQSEMESEGYEIIPFLFPACAVNAPHRRDRIWFIAYSETIQRYKQREEGFDSESGRKSCSRASGISSEGIATNSNDRQRTRRLYDGEQAIGEKERTRVDNRFTRFGNNESIINWRGFPTQPPVCGRNDGIPNKLDRIKGLGNAWVPQAALQIFKAIEQYENILKPTHP